jgi:hypothetical protein
MSDKVFIPEWGPPQETETGWLIETTLTGGAPHQINGPAWVTVKLGLFDWTNDSLEAIRFSRKEDAEKLIPRIAELWSGTLNATEHEWL